VARVGTLSLAGKYSFFYTHCPHQLNLLSSSAPDTELDDTKANAQLRAAPGSSVVLASDPSSSHVSCPPLMEPSAPEAAQVEYTGLAIPAGAMLTFNISTVTYPNLFGRVPNLEHCLIISDDELLGRVRNTLSGPRAQSSNIFPSQSVSPTSCSTTSLTAGVDSPVMHNNSPRSSVDQSRLPQAGPSSIPDGQVGPYIGGVQRTYVHQANSVGYPVDAGPSNIANYSHHTESSHFGYPVSEEAPVASSSRKTLGNIQPGQGGLHYGRAQYPASDFVVLDDPPKRRQQRSKDNRQQPYNKKKKGTRRSTKSSLTISYPISSSTIPSSDDIAKAQASFRTLQARVCPLLVGGQACGVLIDSAKSMLAHLEKHNIQPDKRKTANPELGGRCPLCPCRVDGGSIHRHLMTTHFYYYVCPVEGCHEKFTRNYKLRAHCKTHGFKMSGNEDFAVCKSDSLSSS
jgi:hypothetical protein